MSFNLLSKVSSLKTSSRYFKPHMITSVRFTSDDVKNDLKLIQMCQEMVTGK